MLKLGDLVVDRGMKKEGFVQIYDTDYCMPVTLINGEFSGKTILITSGVHGCEYTAIETAIELAKEINPKNISGKIIIIHPVNVRAFKKKISAVVPDDNKNLNREFPGNIEGTITEKLAHFIENECHIQCDFYIDLHGGDLYEMATNFVYYPGIGNNNIIEESKRVAALLNVNYMVKSNAKTGSYNYAAINGIPSILIEKGGRGLWNNQEIYDYKNDIFTILKHFNVLDGQIKQINEPIDITEAVYLESTCDGCWYPKVEAGQKIKEGELLGEVKDFFGNIIAKYYAKMNGVILYMTVSLSIEKDEPLIAYGKC